MGRISLSCFPASWHFSLSPLVLPSVPLPSFRQLLFVGLLVGLLGLIYLLLVTGKGQDSWNRKDNYFHRHLARVTDVEATDTSNHNYSLVVDCGSSGSRVFVYNGNPHDLKPVVMKIKPSISALAKTPEKASDYIHPLLSFAARHIPKQKHQEIPLYILCTAVMRVLPDSQQEALLEDLWTDIPVRFNFLFSDSHVEVISGVYAWIGINFVLGKFNHVDSGKHFTQYFVEAPLAVITALSLLGYDATSLAHLYLGSFSNSSLQILSSSVRLDGEDIQQESLKGVHSQWRHSFSFVNNHYSFLACFLVVLLSILLYLLRLRRIHSCTTQRCTPSTVKWLEEGLRSHPLPITL
uniref:Ectonucleoside triphosphate diphosphohydrolase 4 n=1 Tax=Oncorhynchus tshawytscha TaxID=74940 RepID=A0A8C8MHB0_ONCTS